MHSFLIIYDIYPLISKWTTKWSTFGLHLKVFSLKLYLAIFWGAKGLLAFKILVNSSSNSSGVNWHWFGGFCNSF